MSSHSPTPAPPDGEDTPQSPTFAQMVSASPPPSQNINPLPTRSLWIRGNERHSVFFNVSGFTKKDLLDFDRQLDAIHHHRATGCRTVYTGPRNAKNRMILKEVGFGSHEDCLVACSTPLPLIRGNSLPELALPMAAEIVHLNLDNLPLIPKTELEEQIQSATVPFGVVEAIIHHSVPNSRIYSGRSTVVINRQPLETSHTWADLPFRFPWTDPTRRVTCTFKSQGVHCRYCLRDGHSIAECPSKVSKIACLNCQQIGHISANCPHPARLAERKRPRRPNLEAPIPPTINKRSFPQLPRSPSPPPANVLESGSNQLQVGSSVTNRTATPDDNINPPRVTPSPEAGTPSQKSKYRSSEVYSSAASRWADDAPTATPDPSLSDESSDDHMDEDNPGSISVSPSTDSAINPTNTTLATMDVDSMTEDSDCLPPTVPTPRLVSSNRNHRMTTRSQSKTPVEY
ncbi:hypothetical protein DM01DRAFT_1393332 [Hesseltinella vesiculosa]|uniref:CCHC-type domain-containing protein n=1 Tax=Hesseltinella vesiculosa TaxID=101127 RepID=A0A1X2GD72_9FUNG|nr:hypothetical protein DM01DRAFT_1393332 [Hesseltinella vesiculosa]